MGGGSCIVPLKIMIMTKTRKREICSPNTGSEWSFQLIDYTTKDS